jgi:hypothetical protein
MDRTGPECSKQVYWGKIGKKYSCQSCNQKQRYVFLQIIHSMQKCVFCIVD